VARPKIICLCGSSRFIESFAVLAWELEKAGNICLGLHYLPPSYCDEVFVINVNGYIGKSTGREIDYTMKLGKPIKYLEPVGVMK